MTMNHMWPNGLSTCINLITQHVHHVEDMCKGTIHKLLDIGPQQFLPQVLVPVQVNQSKPKQVHLVAHVVPATDKRLN
jgi:hypothetical protein